MTEIRRAPATSPSVRISVRRNGWSLPVQLQTDSTYNHEGATQIDTPRGEQQGRLLQPLDSRLQAVHIERLGPADGESVHESYVLTSKDEIHSTLSHRAVRHD